MKGRYFNSRSSKIKKFVKKPSLFLTIPLNEISLSKSHSPLYSSTSRLPMMSYEAHDFSGVSEQIKHGKISLQSNNYK